MNKLPLIALTASLSAGLVGCGDTEEDTVTPFNWTINESNSKNVVSQVFSYEDSQTNATGAITTDSNNNFKSASNQKFFTTPTPLPCNKSGTISFNFTGDDLFSDFTWGITFSACDSNDSAGPVSGSIVITNSLDTPSTGDITGMIDLNLTSQGFTINGDIDSTTFSVDQRIETTFALGINASNGGSVSVVTGSTLVQYAGDLYPSTGEMTITGPLGNKIIVTPVDNTYVQIEVDIGGDGSIENTDIVFWNSL